MRTALRWLFGILAGFVVVVLLAWVGITIWAKEQAGDDVPFTALAGIVATEVLSRIDCAVTGCPPEVAEGLAISVHADELMRTTPVAIDVDEWGRVHIAESDRIYGGAEDNRGHPYWLMDDLASRSVDDRRAYIEKWLAAGKFEDPEHFHARYDSLARLDDTDGDGVPDARHELARWNDTVDGPAAGVEVREGEVFVTVIPDVVRLRDEDGDGEADAIETLVHGYGVKTSLVGHDLHGLVFGPDGRLYFSMGDRGYRIELPDGRVLEPALGPGRGAIFRMKPDGSELEVFATGVRNPQELAFDDYGNLFTGDNNGDGGDKARVVYLVEGGETGWAMPYQTLVGDYIRGPWVAERLWDLAHETQPAWVLPPVGHLGNGPAGFAHYPGLGLPDRYDGHFFLADYGYIPARSGVWSFALEPDGAGFRMVDEHPFVWSVLSTDFDFGWDGHLYVTDFSQIGQTQRLLRASHAEAGQDPRLAETARIAQEGMAARSDAELAELLHHPDQRLRIRAQDALAGRGDGPAFAALARDGDAELVPRLHGLWGLGQLGPDALREGLGDGLAWTDAEAPEFRAQVAKVIGDARAPDWNDTLVAWLAAPDPRVRFFAAQALGRIAAPEAVGPLFAMLRENADRDPFLRHAAIYALYRIGNLDAVLERAGDPDVAVRRAVLLVLRHASDPRIARYLDDPDPLLVVEAARAIYDLPLDGAMPELARLAPGLAPVDEEDRQVGRALHRRVLGANLRVRDEDGALALAGYAADESQLPALRELALEALGEYPEPGPRDFTMGFYRPLETRPPEVVFAALDTHGPALVAGAFGERALEIASRFGRVPLDDDELERRVADASAAPGMRRASLVALAARAVSRDTPGALRAARTALASDVPELRADARDVLVELAPSEGLEELVALDGDASVVELQRAYVALGALEEPRAVAALDRALDQLAAGELARGAQLELIEAARGHGDPDLLGKLGAWENRWARDPASGMVWALEGGDAARGQEVFQAQGDCQRCHVAGGHGAGVGPPLEGVVARRGAPFVLRSLLDPNAEITEGFATVAVTRRDGSAVAGTLVSSDGSGVVITDASGERVEIPADDIVSQTDPVSGMPPLGYSLRSHDLRDVIAYVSTL